MADLLTTFKERASELIATINERGGIRSTIEGLRRQMAEADRRRAMSKTKHELHRLDGQISEMITAVGVQAVGLHKSGHLQSPELAPLCAHIVDLEAAVAKQKAELAQLEALVTSEPGGEQAPACSACGRLLPTGATFCPHCGASAPTPAGSGYLYCPSCGSELRDGARFCASCGIRLNG